MSSPSLSFGLKHFYHYFALKAQNLNLKYLNGISASFLFIMQNDKLNEFIM